MNIGLKMALSGNNNRELFLELLQQHFDGKTPTSCRCDNEEVAWPADNPQALLNSVQTELLLRWENEGHLGIDYNRVVYFGLTGYFIEPGKILEMLEPLSFELASFATLHTEWLNPFTPYEAPSFGDGHLPHGWACAFKGNGFNRLVSNRWLNYGPWKQHIGQQGIQLVQFHELGINSSEALEQARSAHEQMGISNNGGFIQGDYVYQYKNEGLYDAAEKKIKIIVHGTAIPNRQLLDAAAAKHYLVLGEGMPVNNVAYVFMEENSAREHLHAIWLHGLECRAIIDGKETVLSNNYEPPVTKPSWMQNE